MLCNCDVNVMICLQIGVWWWYDLFLDKSMRDEDRILHEHRQQIDELQKDLHEKDQQIEDVMEDYTVQLQVHRGHYVISENMIWHGL